MSGARAAIGAWRWAGVPAIVLGLVVLASQAPTAVAGEESWKRYADDPGGYHMGWGSAHWIPSLKRILFWGGNSHNYRGNNSVRLFDPVTNTWQIIYPSSRGARGVQNRDNHYSFYVPGRGDLGEFWVVGGSYGTAPGAPPGTNFGGRFDLATRTWRNVAQSVAEFGAGVIRDFGYRERTNGARDWCPDLDTGVMFGGSREGNATNDTQLIEPNPGGPEPYTYWFGELPGSPPPRTQLRAQGVCIGEHFYVYGGTYQLPGGPYVALRDLWKLHVPSRTWTRLASGGQGGPHLVLTHDSRTHVLVVHGGNARNDVWVYHLDADRWEDMRPTMTAVGGAAWRRLNHSGAYAPTATRHVYTGGNCWHADGTEASYTECSLTVEGYRYPGRRAAGPPPGLSSAAGPAGSSSPSGITLPLRTWIARPLPNFGKGPCPVGGCKHMRLAHHPGSGRIYFLGGDYSGPGGMQSGRNEVYSYSIAGADWRLEYPYCGPAGDVQPDHPDEVGWVWDSRRNVFWMMPGFTFGLAHPDRCKTGVNLVAATAMTFDPVTRKWSLPGAPLPNLQGTEAGKFAVYDPATDTITMLRWHGGMGSIADVYDIQRKTWKIVSLAWSGGADRIGENLNNAHLDKEYMALDPIARMVYVIDPNGQRLFRYSLDQQRITNLGPLPARTAQDFTIPVWDSVNGVLLWPHIPDLGGLVTLWIYHPDTGRWERDAMRQPEGLTVRGNSAVFDPGENALLLIGGLSEGNTDPSVVKHFFLYRYGNGPSGRREPRGPGGAAASPVPRR